jgi:RimJ/RimL family protein N-acetyltransferase
MEVRPLTRKDAESFRRLRIERLIQDPRAFAESLPEAESISLEATASRLGDGTGDNYIIGAFAPDGELAGMAGFSRSPRLKSRHKATIWGVYVRPQYRGSGVARAIFSELLKRAQGLPGLEQITLTVSTDQIAAHCLYLSLGFEQFGHERHALIVDGKYVDEYHMVRWLRKPGPE